MLRLRRNNFVIASLAFFGAVLLVPVAEGAQDPFARSTAKASDPLAQPTAGASEDNRQASLIDKADEDKPAPGYIYDPTGKTDPFKSFIAEQEAVEEKKRSKPKTYLETLDLAQLELVAVVLNPKENYAMVRDAKGLGHVIKIGTAIGTNGGVVSEIGEGMVVVKEKYRDFRGNTVVKNIKKELPSLE